MVNLASLSSKLYCLCHLSVLTVFLSVSNLFSPVESNAGFRSYQYSYEYTIT